MTSPTASDLISRLLVSVPDFPSQGILFRDLTPVLADAEAFRAISNELAAPYVGRVDVVAGVEARGFLLAASAAYVLGAGVVAIRKAGKLPPVELLSESYDLEYGAATLEMHPAAEPGTRMLLLDDVLATGGTLAAAIRMAERAGYVVVGVGVVIELEGLGGRAQVGETPVSALVTF